MLSHRVHHLRLSSAHVLTAQVGKTAATKEDNAEIENVTRGDVWPTKLRMNGLGVAAVAEQNRDMVVIFEMFLHMGSFFPSTVV